MAKDHDARKEMLDKSGRLAVPQIHIDGDIVVGFNQAELKAKLGIK